MSKVEVKKIVRIQSGSDSPVCYMVYVEVDGQPQTLDQIDTNVIPDFERLQATVFRRTGGLLDPELGKDWHTKLRNELLGEPEPVPEGWNDNDIVWEDDSPLTREEIEAMPAELRDIYEMDLEKEGRPYDGVLGNMDEDD